MPTTVRGAFAGTALLAQQIANAQQFAADRWPRWW